MCLHKHGSEYGHIVHTMCSHCEGTGIGIVKPCHHCNGTNMGVVFPLRVAQWCVVVSTAGVAVGGGGAVCLFMHGVTAWVDFLICVFVCLW